MRKTIIILIIAVVSVFASVILYKINIAKNSVLTCIRDNDDKVIIKFNSEGIKQITINDKEIDELELMKYKTNFISSFIWNEMASEDKSELELIKEHMEDVKNFEESNEEYNSKCDY